MRTCWPGPTCRRSGFTLVELVLTVAIVGMLLVVGWGSLDRWLPRYRTRHAAIEFANAVDHLRILAVSENRQTALYLADYDPDAESGNDLNIGVYWRLAGNAARGSTTWEFLPTDAQHDGSDDDQSEGIVDIGAGSPTRLKDVSLAGWGTIGGPDGLADHLVFSPFGWLANPNSDFDSHGYVEIRFTNKAAYREGRAESYTVRIARSGFARVDFNDSQFVSVSGHGHGVDAHTRVESASSGGG
ncbi:MAG: type II secretion system protein [Deltaproteobacteria bacterium]|nr:type II secretion system protein [Deltaproteobacteria bacterium]